MTWSDLLDDPCFGLIEQDLQDIGVDLGDKVMLRSRSWRWLRVRIVGLLNRPMTIDGSGQAIYPNRIQEQVYAPQLNEVRARASEATSS